MKFSEVTEQLYEALQVQLAGPEMQSTQSSSLEMLWNNKQIWGSC